MRKPTLSLPIALAGLVVALCLSGISSFAQVDVPANLSIAPPADYPGSHLKGEYWKRPTASILTDGRTVRDNGIDKQIQTFGPPNGTFKATRFVYLGGDLTPVQTWLSSDALSYSGINSNLDDGAFRFSGYINVPTAGVLSLGLTSDDGSRITIGGLDIAERDGSHGDETQDVDVNFLAAGIYPIEVTYFGGDWTSDGNNHSGSPDPGLHGGNNFHLRMGGADITSAQVAARFYPAAPLPATVWQVGKDDGGWPVGNGGGPEATFVQENGVINPLPGSPTSPETDQQADNDYYFAGSYTTTIPGNGAYAPVGTVAANEEAAERAFAAADNDLRYHFNLPTNLDPLQLLSVTFDANNLHDGQADTRYGIEVYVNNVLVQTQIVIRAAQLDVDFTTPPFTLAHVNAQTGPGFDNIVSLRGINYNNDGGGNWMGIDYVKLNVEGRDPAGAGLVRGYLTKYRYDNIGAGVNVADLLTNPKYVNNAPDVTCLRSDFSANDANECNECGYSVRGFFIPSASGPHIFHISADDGAALYLSTDENPANKAQIATEPLWTGRRDFVGEAAGGGRGTPPSNISAPIDLVAGSLYYIEGVMKEGGGGDNLDVAVQGPGDPAVADGDRPIFGDRIATRADLSGSTLAIVQNPLDAQVPEGDAVTFTVVAAANSPLCGGQTTYQWQRKGATDADFTDIAGANSAIYTLGPVRVDDHFAQFRAVVKIPGIIRISAAATLQVVGRDCLRVAGAVGSGDMMHVILSFSTFINQTNVSTTDAFNYSITSAGSVVTGLRFTTANDSPARDPMTFTLEGTAGDPASGPWTLIASGNTGLDPVARGATAPDVHFANTAAYRSYRLLFPTVRDAASANSMQIAEVVFLDAANNDVTLPGNTVIGVRATAGSATSEVAVVGTTANANNYPAAESPDKTIDNVTTTKYLNFAKLNTGIIVTAADAGGTLVVSAVSLGGDGKSVILTTDPQTENALYLVTAENVESLVGSPLCASPTNQALARAFITGCGGGILQTYPIGGGVDVNALRNHPSFPNSPDFVGPISSFDIRVAFDPANPSFYSTDARENYGGRLRGMFIAPESGPHTFYYASDDNGELWLSTDEIPSHKVLIARESTWSSSKEWTTSGGGSGLGVGGKKSAPINLQAGKAYYIEALYHEGGGGDNAAVAVQLPSQSAPPANGGGALPASLLGGAAPAGLLGQVTVSQQPANQSLAENTTATFTVGVNSPTFEDFPLPVCYQWLRDGVEIAGATGPSYSFGPVTLADDGARFQVRLSVIGSPTASAEALLNVVSDTIRPTAVSAAASLSLSNIVVRFSEPVSANTAQDTFNYDVPGFGVVGAVLSADGRSVTLGLDGSMTPGGNYTVVVQHVADLATNPIDPDPTTLAFRAPVRSCGFVQQNIYLNIGGVAVADLLNNPNYPNNPDIIRYQSLIEANTFDEFENYGTRLSGWLLPPVSGNYNFFMSSDDGGAFFLSTDDSPGHLVLIASEPVWNGRRDWTGTVRRNAAAPENRSSTLFPGGIPLTAGSSYYFEAFMKEGGGGDNLAVTWQIPGQPVPAPGSSPIDGSFLASLAQPAGAAVTITRQPCPNNICLPVPGVPPAQGGVPLASQDFNTGNGGCTVTSVNGPFEGPWVYNAGSGSWSSAGQSAELGRAPSTRLTCPPVTVTQGGNVQMSFSHRYSFEGGFWDGGQVLVSVNGSAFTAVPANSFIANGYNGNVLATSAAALAGQAAFVENSPDYATPAFITSTINLGCLSAGDTVAVQFLAAFDTNTRQGDPAWQIDSVSFTQGVIGGTTASFNVAATGTIAGNPNVVPFVQWQKSTAGGPFVNISGATGNSYSFNPTLADNGSCYRAVVYVPGATATSASACLTVNQPNTPPTFTCGTNQNAAKNSGAQTVAGWATGISPDSIASVNGNFSAAFAGAPALASVTNTYDFSAVPAGASLAGNSAVTGGILHLTDAINSQQGGFATAPFAGTIDSFTATFKARIGGGTCCGARTADGWTFNFGPVTVPLTFPVAAEEGVGGASLTLSFDSWDNAGFGDDDAHTAPNLDVKVGGAVIAYQAFDGVREGGRAPSGPFITDPATGLPMTYTTGNDFVPVRVHLDADGTLDVDFKGVRIFDNVPTGLAPSVNPIIAFAARTGGANDNHWIDDLEVVTTGVQAVPAPPGSALLGNAYIADGRLHLTDALNDQTGSFIVNDLLGGAQLGSFIMTFDALVGQGTAPPADGFSVSVANNIGGAAFGEEGDGNGLRVAFDSFDNGGGEAPAIDVYWNGVVIAHTPVPGGLETAGNFVPVIVKLDSDGTLDVTAAGTPVYVNLATGYTPITGARFGLGGRTGGLNERNWIDNLNIAAVAVNPGDAEQNQTVQFIVSNSNPSLFSAQPSVSPTGVLTYTPAPNACGSAQVTVTAKDNGGTAACNGQDTSAPCVFTINIACVNECPVANAQSVTTGEDTAKAITLTGTDPDGSALTYAINTSPAHGTLAGAAPNVTYTPAANYCGPDGFTFTVNDGECVRTAAVTIAVICANDCPVAGSFSVTVNSGVAVPVPLVGSDLDADPLTYTVGTPSHGTLSGVAPALSYTSAAGYSGPDSFTYTVNDGTCSSPAATVSITVRPVTGNNCPVAHAIISNPCSVPDPHTLFIISADGEEGCVVLDGTGSTDADGDTLTYAWYMDGASIPFARGAVVSNCFDIDGHRIQLVVDDGRCVGTATVDFEVITACDAVEDLIHDVNNANLQRKNKRPLLSSLKAACASFERGNINAGINQLEAFQNKVHAQIERNNPVEAARFIATAQDIIDAVRCSRDLDQAIDSEDDDDDDDNDNGHGNGNGHWWW